MSLKMSDSDVIDRTTVTSETRGSERSESGVIVQADDYKLVQLERGRLKQSFLNYLEDHLSDIQSIVAHQLFLRKHQSCVISRRSEWMDGDFNICIPISVPNWRSQRLLLRCPCPYMLGANYIDSVDEKVRCDAASLAWIPDHCNRVPVPHLWGFGLPCGLSFTSTSKLPWYLRIFNRLRSCWAWLRMRPRYAPFLPRRCSSTLKSGYLLVDFIEKDQGILLSRLGPPPSLELKQNLHRSLSRIILDLASHPQAKIGSFTIHNSGEMSLSNRPLTRRLPLLESEGIPIDIPRSRCYTTTDSYLHDLLRCLDLRLMHRVNVGDKFDIEGMMAVLTVLRALKSHIAQPSLNHGPFVICWTDPSPNNFFVDQHYNITSIIDSEWCCSLPLETIHPPFWLSGHTMDDLEGEKEESFNSMCEEFLGTLHQEDNHSTALGPGFCTKVVKEACARRMHWLWACINEPRGTYDLFVEHLQSQYAPEQSDGKGAILFQEIIAPYWTSQAMAFIERKLEHQSQLMFRQ